MSRFFIEKENVKDNYIEIKGSDVNHICNALRYKAGDTLKISDGYGNGYDATISVIEKDNIICNIISSYRIEEEPSYKVILFQGIPKKDKFELIVQKATELGVSEIYPVKMERSIGKIDEKKEDKKITRLSEIARMAAIQSGRGVIPIVHNPISLKEGINISKDLDKTLVPYETNRELKETRKYIEEIKKDSSIGIFIGPEGGFSIKEVEDIKSIGGREISLGKRILRTETASLSVLSFLIYELEFR